MIRTTALATALAAAALPAIAQDSACLDGMQWSLAQAGSDRQVATYSACEGGDVALAVACQDGTVQMAVGAEAGAARDTAIAVDAAVDEEIYTLPGTVTATRGRMLPLLAIDAPALEALIRGQRASLALHEGALDLHLTGSARALTPIRAACAP